MANGLTPRQERFVQAMVDPAVESQSEAARRAGYQGEAAAAAWQALHRSTHVETAVATAKAKQRDRARGSLERLEASISRAINALEKLDLTDPMVAIANAKVLFELRDRAAAYEQRTGSGEQEQRITVGLEIYYESMRRWAVVVDRRGRDRADRYARIAQRLGAPVSGVRKQPIKQLSLSPAVETGEKSQLPPTQVVDVVSDAATVSDK